MRFIASDTAAICRAAHMPHEQPEQPTRYCMMVD